MKRSLALISALSLFAAVASAATAKTYQVTGHVVEVSDDMIVVLKEKGKDEKWEIARDKDTKVTGDLKVGAKVTIMYRMTATTADVKAETAKAAKPAAKKSTTAAQPAAAGK